MYGRMFRKIVSRVVLVCVRGLGRGSQRARALNVDEDDRAGQMGSFNTFKDLLGLPAPIIGGLLFDFFGFYVPLLLNLCFALFDAYLLLRFISTGE